MSRGLCVLFILTCSASLFAGGDNPEADRQLLSAQEAYDSGKFQRAIEIYDGIRHKYPSYESYWPVMLNLGILYLQTDQNVKAIEIFKEIIAKCKDPEAIEQGNLYMAGATAGLVTAETKPEERAKIYKESIGLYDEFLKKYSKSRSLPEAYYGKAAVQYQIDDLDGAEKTLGQFFKEINKGSVETDAKYLLARVYASQARVILEKRMPDSKEKSRQLIDNARKLFDEVSGNLNAVSLANDALLSAGDTFLHAEQYDLAVGYLRKVKPKEQITEKQRLYVEDIYKKQRQAILDNDNLHSEKLLKQYQKEKRFLDQLLEGRSDFHSAQILAAQCYYNQKKFDEILILLRHFLSTFNPSQRKSASFFIIMALIGKQDLDHAIEEYKKFDEIYPKDKVAEGAPAAFSQLYIDIKKFDEAVKWCDEYLSKFPSGQYEEQILFFKVNALTTAGKTDEAQKTNEEFCRKYPNSDLRGAALFLKAVANYNKKDYDKALKDFREYAESFKKSKNAELAGYYVLIILSETKKFDDLLKESGAFEAKFPKSQFIPTAIFMCAQADEGKKDLPAANLLYDRILKEFSSNQQAARAVYLKAMNLFSLKKKPEGLKTLNELIARFPDHPLVPPAYMVKADELKNAKKYDEAIEAYKELIQKFPGTEASAEALISIGSLFIQRATMMAGHPEKLEPDKQVQWKEFLRKAQESYEEVVKNEKYQHFAAVDKALSELCGVWQRRVQAAFAGKEEAVEFFNKLVPGTEGDLHVKVKFALGTLLSLLGDKESAVKAIRDAYENAKKTEISLPNAGYEQYRKLLFDTQQFDEIISVSERQLEDKQKSNDDKGVAEALLGRGKALFEKGDADKAGVDFNQITSKYPWHQKAATEAQFYLTWIEEKKKNFQEAIKGYGVLLPKLRADMEMRVKVFLRLGQCWLGKAETSSATRATDLSQAFSYFMQLGYNFKMFPASAAEGLYMCGVVSEMETVPKEPKNKTIYNKQDAIKFYEDCAREFPDTPWGPKSKDRLKAMGK